MGLFEQTIYECIGDEFNTYIDENDQMFLFEDSEEEIFDGNVEIVTERVTKRKVIRKGKKYWKYESSRPGYKIVFKGKGKKRTPKEVRIKAKEKTKRKISSKRGARKRKAKQRSSIRARKKSLKRRSRLGNTSRRPG